MADIRDEHGNPIQLTDEFGKPVQLTDEYGNPMHIKGSVVGATAGGQDHRRSSSSSSEEDDGLGGRRRRNKGPKEKIRETEGKIKETIGTTGGGGHFQPHSHDQAEHHHNVGSYTATAGHRLPPLTTATATPHIATTGHHPPPLTAATATPPTTGHHIPPLTAATATAPTGTAGHHLPPLTAATAAPPTTGHIAPLTAATATAPTTGHIPPLTPAPAPAHDDNINVPTADVNSLMAAHTKPATAGGTTAHSVPTAGAVGGEQVHQKRGVVGKIKDKISGHHH